MARIITEYISLTIFTGFFFFFFSFVFFLLMGHFCYNFSPIRPSNLSSRHKALFSQLPNCRPACLPACPPPVGLLGLIELMFCEFCCCSRIHIFNSCFTINHTTSKTLINMRTTCLRLFLIHIGVPQSHAKR